jgi:hypothetical protein
MELIYCGGGNKRFAQIAMDHGFLYGSRLPATVYGPLHFADQDWRKPNRSAYMAALARHRPYMASVMDLEQEEQLDEVLSWANEAAQHVRVVMLIPKVFGIIPRLPRRIGNADVRIGYSVPTSHGGTELPVWEFSGWPVHLLGGSPGDQMHLAHYMDVVSADGNMPMKVATRFCQYWDGGWKDIDVTGYNGGDVPYEAFRLSCKNIMQAWRNVTR